MGLKDIWNKTSFARKAEADKLKKEEEQRLKAEVMEELKPEIERIKKEKIKEELIAVAKGEKKEETKKNTLKMIGEEFKQSNIGSNDQMDKLLGRQGSGKSGKLGTEGLSGGTLKDTNKLAQLMGGKVKTDRNFGDEIGLGVVQKERDIPGMLGRNSKVRDDYGDIIGFRKKSKDVEDRVGIGSKEQQEEKIRKMLGGRK